MLSLNELKEVRQQCAEALKNGDNDLFKTLKDKREKLESDFLAADTYKIEVEEEITKVLELK